MFLEFVMWFFLFGRSAASQEEDVGFTYNGFRGVNMSLDGLAQITDNGLLMLVNGTTQQVGHAFYPHPLHFRNSSTGNAFSFSTTFVFALERLLKYGASGMAFVIAPSRDFSGALPGNYLGLFNMTNVGKQSNHVIAIELDTFRNKEFKDIDGNHNGIDINDLKSVQSAPASYFSDEENRYVNLSLRDMYPLQLWVDYSGAARQLIVTLAPIDVPKPTIPLLSLEIDLSQTILNHPMLVGFSTATFTLPTSHYVLGWSFKMNGVARELTLSQLPKLPQPHKMVPRLFIVLFAVISATLVLISIFFITQFMMKRKKKFAEVFEDWELNYRPHRFKYKDLYIATRGFKEKELLGTGGFGSVYRGVLPLSKTEVAVKRVSYNSRQLKREFITEIISIGQLRHRNIVPLLGYCRRKRELLLVYDLMPNGSLDKFLFDQTKSEMTLNWGQRFRIIKSIAAALLYLHEEWEKVVVHRDVKSSNVLLDEEFNGRLGDFGLARLYDHGTAPQTTHVVGTIGYLAPELCRTGKAKPSVDVFAFGVFLLEVACGRRPIEPQASEDSMVLVDWVISCWSKGMILDTVDPKLGMDYDVQEMEMVLKLGMLCSHSIPTARPHMRQVVRYLDGEAPLSELTLPGLSTTTNDTTFVTTIGSNLGNATTRSSSFAESILSGGR